MSRSLSHPLSPGWAFSRPLLEAHVTGFDIAVCPRLPLDVLLHPLNLLEGNDWDAGCFRSDVSPHLLERFRPLFRVHDLPGILDRLVELGVRLLVDEDGVGAGAGE